MKHWWLLNFIILLLDQFSKLLVIKFFPSWIVKNQGVSFGLMASNLWFLVNLVILMGLIIYLKENWAKSLIIGGGISNLLDRLFRGAVIDYIHLGILPVFNLGDIFICLGIVILIINNIRTIK